MEDEKTRNKIRINEGRERLTRIRKRGWGKWVRKDSRVIEHGQLGSYRKGDKELVLEDREWVKRECGKGLLREGAGKGVDEPGKGRS